MSGRKILIIDDDELLVGAIQRKFETAGFQVITATRGGQGRERVKSDSPDLVILDLALPDDDGTDICRDVRAFSRVPIIMLTGRAEETDRIVALVDRMEVFSDERPIDRMPVNIHVVLDRVKAIAANGFNVLEDDKGLHPAQNIATRRLPNRLAFARHHDGKSRKLAVPGSTAPRKLPIATS